MMYWIILIVLAALIAVTIIVTIVTIVKERKEYRHYELDEAYGGESDDYDDDDYDDRPPVRKKKQAVGRRRLQRVQAKKGAGRLFWRIRIRESVTVSFSMTVSGLEERRRMLLLRNFFPCPVTGRFLRSTAPL